MFMSLGKQLTVVLLLVVVLLVPLIAHDLTSGASKNTCACQLLLTDCSTDQRQDQSDPFPANTDHRCDCQEGGTDTAEPPVAYDMTGGFSSREAFQPSINGHIPDVYLAIFVPPENRSFPKH